jgi:hypothetical protein
MRFGKPEQSPRARKLHPTREEEARPVAPVAAAADGLIGEGEVVWDANGGHNHDGTVSRAVDHGTLANVTPNQHHDQVHPLVGSDHSASGLTTGHLLTATGATSFAFQAPAAVTHQLLSATHSDTTAASCSRGALVTGQGASPVWARLTLGASGTVLRSDGTDAAWSTDTHALLSGRHSDATAAAPTRGDLITAQGASPTWTRLGKSATATHVLKAGASEPAWGQVAHSELSGVGANDHHPQAHVLATTAGLGADHTVSGLTAGQVLKATGTSTAAFGALALSDASGSISAAQHGTQASTAGSTADHTGTLSANARLQAQKNGTGVGSPRPTFNFKEGANITLTVSDTGSVVDVTIASAGGVTAHNLLSTTHGDTTAGTVARGDLVVGQGASPTWSRLALGVSGRYLRSNGTDAAWAQVPHSDLTFSGLTAGYAWRASSATAATFAQLSHADLDPATVTADQHHAKQHNLWDSANHGDVTGTPAAGDLIYRNGSSQWARLPKGSDGQILKLASGAPSWSAVNAVATTRALIQGWKRNDIRNAGNTDTEMNGFDGLNTGECMAFSGALVGIAVTLERDVDNGGAAGSASYTLTAYKSSDQGLTWSSTAATVTLSAGAGTERRAYGTGFSVSFAAGDLLSIYDRKASLPGVANGCKANLIVVFD